ncbi:hypothetical protein DL546_001103 [Coniochaeta pulveracea]|uniref:Pyridoxamine 5'-phosphate oxidase N-terminal domain-containing protein n=1 Tax=Coniochaeta pulveracea TaxID=177199 RepID=A0A420Y5Q1_9PEZI|nr:hypothetical protein DL546_001103 [Coniochaeta pulveracea]
MDNAIPLTHAPSSGDCNKTATSSLPPAVETCLQNARFLHLATSHSNTPHISLMSYTYLPPSASPFNPSSPVIIMTTNASSKKYENLQTNPTVSLLVHDWVYHRPPTTTSGRRLSGGEAEHMMSPMASLLMNMNTSAVSSISATIGGDARLVEPGTEEDKFYRRQHLENNTFEGESGGPVFGQGRRDSMVGVAERENGKEDDDVRVIVVGIRDVRISDYKGGVSDYVLVPPKPVEDGGEEGKALQTGLNGI